MTKSLKEDDLERDYYKLLAVDPSAPAAVIRAAYRAIMSDIGRHPDKGGTHEDAVVLNRAKEILLNPVLRAEYDRSRLKRVRANHNAGHEHAGNSRSGAFWQGKLYHCRCCGGVAEPVWRGQKRPRDMCKKCFWSQESS